MTARLPPWVWIVLAASLSLLPFIQKPLFVDDHAIFEQAQALRHNPMVPYRMEQGTLGWQKGEDVGEDNPPVFFYLLTFAIALFGSEPFTARLLIIPIQIFGILAFYAIARRYVQHAVWATIILIVTPHLWVTSNSLLVDSVLGHVMWLALFAWIRAWETQGMRWGLTAGVLLGCAPLIKYTGFLIWPVSALWTFSQHTKWKSKTWLWLVIPTVLFGAWLLYTHHLYGADHFSATAESRMTRFHWANFQTVLTFVLWTTPVLSLAILARLTSVFSDKRRIAPSFWTKQNTLLATWIALGILGLSIALGWTCARFLVIITAPLILWSVRIIETYRPSWLKNISVYSGTASIFILWGLLFVHADYTRAQVEQDAGRWANAWIQNHGWKGPAYFSSATRGGLSAYLDVRIWRPASPRESIAPGSLVLIPHKGLPPYFLPAITHGTVMDRKEFQTWNPIRLLDTHAQAGWYGSIWGKKVVALSSAPLEIYFLVRTDP